MVVPAWAHRDYSATLQEYCCVSFDGRSPWGFPDTAFFTSSDFDSGQGHEGTLKRREFFLLLSSQLSPPYRQMPRIWLTNPRQWRRRHITGPAFTLAPTAAVASPAPITSTRIVSPAPTPSFRRPLGPSVWAPATIISSATP